MNDRLPIVLASQSPRRRALLEQAGWEFQVIPPPVSAECGVCSRETPPEMVARLGFQKARDVALKLDYPALVLGCDTVAECCGQVLGKPYDRQHAKEMLSLMSGREHRVYSGVCLWRRPDDHFLGAVACTKLRMDKLSSEQLDDYLDSGQWEGKAGAFGFQDELDWVHILEGSESNVVGLPMELLDQMLGELEADSAGSTSNGPSNL